MPLIHHIEGDPGHTDDHNLIVDALDSHTSTLSSHTSTLSSHDSTLSSHTSTLAGLGSLATLSTVASAQITDGTVANGDLANMVQATVKGRAVGAGTGAPGDLTQTQLTALINTFSSSLSGAAPASGGGTSNFLRADGTWTAPGGGGSAASITFTPAAGVAATDVQAAIEEVANDVLDLPTLSSSDTAIIDVTTAGGVTTLDVDQVVSRTGTVTLTNKTLTAPVITSAFLHQSATTGITIRNTADTFVNDYSRSNPIEIYGISTGLTPVIAFLHNGGVPGTPSATLNNAGIGRMTMRGYDGTAFVGTSVSFFATAAENFTSTNHGGFAGISVTPTGASQTLTEAIRMTADATPNVVVRNGLSAGSGSSMTSPATGYSIESKLSGIGYGVGAGGAVTQGTSRTTGVTLNECSGAITLVTATGSVTPASFTVTNSTVAAADTIVVSQKSGSDLYEIFVTAVAAGSFRITSFTTGGTTSEQPVFTFAVLKGAVS